MTPTTDTDLTLPLFPEATRENRGPVPLAAYVPITVAIIGVAFILVGGLRSYNAPAATVAGPSAGIDATVTGAIKAQDATHSLDWLRHR